MRPEVLAQHISTTIRGLVEPLHRTLRDQQKEISDLKHAFAALEIVTTRQATALDGLRDENKALGNTLVAVLEPSRQAPSAEPTRTKH